MQQANSPAKYQSSWIRQFLNGRNQARSHERRVFERRRQSFDAEISTPEGRLPVLGVDFHRDGAMVVSKQPLAAGSVVFVHLKTQRLMGFGHVRHCTPRRDWSYLVGLEFRAPLMQEEIGTWEIQRVSAAQCESPEAEFGPPEDTAGWSLA